MLAEILAELLARASRKHHVRHHQINSPLALFINLHRLLRILGRQNFKARAFEDTASRLAHKRLVLNQKNGPPPRPIVREYMGLKSHTSTIHFPDNSSSSNRMAPPSSQTRHAPHQRLHLFGLYFGAVRIVCFGSSTIFRTLLGAISRNPVSAPSASTSPRKTSPFPAVVAYTGTAVTRSSGTSFCTITPVTVVSPAFSVMRISRASSSGIAVPSIQPSKNQSNLGRFSYQSGRGSSSSKTCISSCVLMVLPAYRALIFRSPRKNGSSEFVPGFARPFRERDAVSESRSIIRSM